MMMASGYGGKGKGKGFSRPWSKGTGCVEFASAREAQNSIRALQGSMLDGRPLKLDSWSGGKTQRSGKGDSSSKVYVSNLSYKTRNWKLREHFAAHGTVTHADVMID